MDPSWPLDPCLVFSFGRSIQDFQLLDVGRIFFFASKKTEPAGGCPAGSDVFVNVGLVYFF